MIAPVELVARRLDGVRGDPRKCRATCPVCRRKGALSVGEGRDGRALIRCFAGCDTATIARAIGLGVTELFAGDDARQERDAEHRRFAAAPRATVREALSAELDALRKRLRAELGYDRPLRASDVNSVRAGVSRMFQLDPALPPVPPFPWECPGHDDDPAWPTLFEAALEEEVRRRWHSLRPQAEAWESDPQGASVFDRMRAEELASKWLRSMAS